MWKKGIMTKWNWNYWNHDVFFPWPTNMKNWTTSLSSNSALSTIFRMSSLFHQMWKKRNRDKMKLKLLESWRFPFRYQITGRCRGRGRGTDRVRWRTARCTIRERSRTSCWKPAWRRRRRLRRDRNASGNAPGTITENRVSSQLRSNIFCSEKIRSD